MCSRLRSKPSRLSLMEDQSQSCYRYGLEILNMQSCLIIEISKLTQITQIDSWTRGINPVTKMSPASKRVHRPTLHTRGNQQTKLLMQLSSTRPAQNIRSDSLWNQWYINFSCILNFFHYNFKICYIINELEITNT